MGVKVSVYMAAFNYGNYIEKAIESVIGQTMSDWELIIINDGSTDNTREVLENFRGHSKIKIINQENKGLNKTNNIALRLATGKYIVRLDADDYLDENALLLLTNTLDAHDNIDLVYPDYYLIDQDGKVIELVRRKKIEEEVQLLDLPAHGACTMFRTSVLRQIGGYIEDYTCQDGYEMWLRFIQRHKPYNVNMPLFYYRQHPASLTKNQEKILSTRRKIKSRFVEKSFNGSLPKVMAFIPATRKAVYHGNDPFVELAGKPLIEHTVKQALEAKTLDRIVVSSEDQEVLAYVKDIPGITPVCRDPSRAPNISRMEHLLVETLDILKKDYDYEPEAVCSLFINTPLRKAYHVDWAVNTMKIFDLESVISVQEELAHCYQHRRFGLKPISLSRDIRLERDAIYKENGAVFLSRTEVLRRGELIGKTVGHITMLPEESVKINSDYEFWLAEQIMLNRGKEKES